jgi:hypothetical protein
MERTGARRLGLLTAGALAVALTVMLAGPGSALASFGISRWEAGTCKVTSCSDSGPHEDFYTQADGHPPFGITDFLANYTEVGLVNKAKQPEGHIRDVRVDLPSGLAVNPEATVQCKQSQLESFACPPESQVGEDEATGTVEIALGQKATATERFPVYDMEPRPGEPSRFGVEVNSETLRLLGLQGAIYLEGGISWHAEAETSESSGVPSGDFHEFFRIPSIPQQPELVESKLIFWGTSKRNQWFIRLPSTCSERPVTYLHVDSYEHPGSFLGYANQTPVTATGCGALSFTPTLTLSGENGRSEQPDGVDGDLHVPQRVGEPEKPSSPDVQSTEVTLPEGLTLNPPAARGLQACSDAQIGIGTGNPIACPPASIVGDVRIDAPGIPNGSLLGNVYVGTPEPGADAESGGKYRIFIAAEAPRYGVGIRLQGRVKANRATGRLTATFAGTPEVPFEDFTLHFNGGPRATLANPLPCGPAEPLASVTPYGGRPAASAQAHGFAVSADPSGGPCPAGPPFALVQEVPPQSPAQAGAYSPFTLAFQRSDGEQYLAETTTTLPPGLLGAIPSVTLCGEPQASLGTCPASSRIGTVTAAVGAGPEPYVFTGSAYLTGPYGGAPYGLSIVVPASAGPYDLGEVVTRARIAVGMYDGRVRVSATLPRIVEGIPLRLRGVRVAVDRPRFLFNPTSCGVLATESLLLSSFGASQALSSPFQVGGCGSLRFAPALAAATSAHTSAVNGASLEVTLAQAAHQANIRQVLVQLPRQLPARLTTIQKACPAASFQAGTPPGSCPASAQVGSVSVTTPVLPGRLSGPAYLVSHGGQAFPDLDLILRGDGVQVVLVGHTHISTQGVTTSNFESLPDVPVSSVTVTLPMGPNSAVGARGSLCRSRLLAPTTIVAQSGARLAQKTTIVVRGCPFTVLSERISHGHAILVVMAPAAGRLAVSGRAVRGRFRRRLRGAGVFTLSVPLRRGTTALLRRHRHARIALRVSYRPAARHARAVVVRLRLR